MGFFTNKGLDFMRSPQSIELQNDPVAHNQHSDIRAAMYLVNKGPMKGCTSNVP